MNEQRCILLMNGRGVSASRGRRVFSTILLIIIKRQATDCVRVTSRYTIMMYMYTAVARSKYAKNWHFHGPNLPAGPCICQYILLLLL